MSAHILSAISHLPQLRGSLRHTAQRLGYFANIRGTVSERSHSYLAADLHVSARTIMRHVARLQELALLTKHTLWLASKQCAINVYQFSLEALGILHICDPDKVSGKQAQQERKRSAQGMPPRPLSLEANLQGCREVLARLGLAPRSP